MKFTAYDILKRNYDHSARTPGLIHNLKLAEERLNIATSQRIPDSEPTPTHRQR